MLVYALNLFSIGCYAVLSAAAERRGHSRQIIWFSRLVAVQLILILAFRDSSIGVDVQRYMADFQRSSSGVLTDSRFEPGFLLLMRGVALITAEIQALLTVVAVLCIVPVAIVIERISKAPMLSWGLYVCLNFYGFAFSGLRQGIAMGLAALAILCVQRRKPVGFIVLVLTASLFHSSAWLFIPAYFVYKFRFTARSLVLVAPTVLAVFLLRKVIFAWGVSMFYTDYSVVESPSYSWFGLSIAVIGLVGTRLGQMRVKSPEAEGLFSLALAGVVVMSFASLGTNVMRVADYYYLSIIFVVPAALTTLTKEWSVIVKFVVVPLMVAVYFFLVTTSAYEIYPYKSYLG